LHWRWREPVPADTPTAWGASFSHRLSTHQLLMERSGAISTLDFGLGGQTSASWWLRLSRMTLRRVKAESQSMRHNIANGILRVRLHATAWPVALSSVHPQALTTVVAHPEPAPGCLRCPP
jgi:hypothetical protein